MKLPATCPHRRSAKNWSSIEDTDRCCRNSDCDIHVFLPKETSLCNEMNYAIEEYRFVWRSSFNGEALVHLRRFQNGVRLQWACSGLLGDGRFSRSINTDAWARLEHALLAAGFWVASPEEWNGIMLDGAAWLVEGRRRDVYRALRRDSPGGPIYDLGRVFLDLAGPPITGIELY